MANDVFISYSRKDEDFVKELYQALTDRDVSSWYDRHNIQVGNQWATEIVEGIRDCQIFLLALSPDSVASVNVRKELDLAQRYQKQIVPLIWRPTEIPVAMEYQLAGIQWIEFNQSTSDEKFSQLIGVLHRLLNRPPAPEASTGQADPAGSVSPVSPKTGKRGRLGGLKKKQTPNPVATGAAVISSVVVTFGLEIEEQDFVNNEIKWLFSATDHFLKIKRGQSEPTAPILVPIPPDAEQQAQATNRLLPTVNAFDSQIWEGQLESALKRITIHLKNLTILLDQEAQKGPAGKGDVYLQNQIQGARIEIVKILQEMAQLMNQAYGVLVTSPEQLTQLLE